MGILGRCGLIELQLRPLLLNLSCLGFLTLDFNKCPAGAMLRGHQRHGTKYQ
jgi:hypothetical protein